MKSNPASRSFSPRLVLHTTTIAYNDEAANGWRTAFTRLSHRRPADDRQQRHLNQGHRAPDDSYALRARPA